MTKLKWGIIGSAIAGSGALILLIPAVKGRAMRVTTILKKDHLVVSGLMKTLQMTPKINSTVRKRLFEEIRHRVMVHAQAEEDVVYPAMQNILFGSGSTEIDEAYHEQQQVKDLLGDLETMDPMSEAFDRKFADFKRKLEHHVEREESEMFVMLAVTMSVEQQEKLGKRLHERKEALRMKQAA